MFRNVLALGLSAILGVVALKIVAGLFGIAGGLLGAVIGLFLWIVSLAIRVAVVGLLLYLVLRVVSPETARRMRRSFGGGY